MRLCGNFWMHTVHIEAKDSISLGGGRAGTHHASYTNTLHLILFGALKLLFSKKSKVMGWTFFLSAIW